MSDRSILAGAQWTKPPAVRAQPLLARPERAAAERAAQRWGEGSLPHLVLLWRARHIERRELLKLAYWQPDPVLEDLDLDRRTVLREAEKPFWRA